MTAWVLYNVSGNEEAIASRTGHSLNSSRWPACLQVGHGETLREGQFVAFRLSTGNDADPGWL